LLISVRTYCPVETGLFFYKMTTPTPITTTKKVELSFTLPAINFEAFIQRTVERAAVLFSNIYNPISSSVSNASSQASSRAKRLRFPKMNNGGFDFKKINFKKVLPVLAGVIVLAAIISIVRSLPDAQSRPTTDESKKAANLNALATVHLDRKFVFPLKDEKDKQVGSFDYVIQSATIQKQIIVQGQRATAVDGRVFLILNLKITNNLKQTIKLNTRDYMRLVTEGNKNEQLAPDIHNDPVEVQAISTKYTRVGVAVDEADAKKIIQLKVGEIDGDKKTIDLNFKY